MNETEIRYLRQEEKKNSRALYEICFPEDTGKFTDYYYKEKCRDNRIAALYSEGQMATMVHANPFTVSMYGKKARVSYIVAVATHPDFRKRGFMRKLLGRVLRDCYENREPFSFLMPADAAYYESIGYRFWDSQIEWKLSPGGEEVLSACIAETAGEPELRAAETANSTGKPELRAAGIPDERENNIRLADFANRILEQNFDLYIHRDAAYYERLKKEQQSEDGDVILLQDEAGEAAGCFCYSAEDDIEIREPILGEDRKIFPVSDTGYGSAHQISFRSDIQEVCHPMMMGRIVHLQNFVENLCFSTPFSETISLSDDMIPENNGVFRICIDAAGGKAERVETRENVKAMDMAENVRIMDISEKPKAMDMAENVKTMDIAELGRILFDRMRIFVNELV